MKKKSILLSLLLILFLTACKIESKNSGEAKLVREDFNLDIMDKDDDGSVVDFGSNVYSFNGAKDLKYRLKLISFDKGEEEEIFDFDLPSIEEGEKLGFEISSNGVNIYEISEKKIVQNTKYDFTDQIFENKEAKLWEWTEGGLLNGDESYPVFAAFLADSSEFSFIDLENPDFRSQFKNNKDISALVLELSLDDSEK